jgi:DNA-binding MarR family transcriptional regulator
MALIHVAAVEDDPGPVLDAVRELGAERVILAAYDEPDDAEVATVLDPLGVETETRAVEGSMLLGTVQLVQAIAHDHAERREETVVNLGSAGRYQSCALLSAAFVAGVRAIDVQDGQIRRFPVLDFAYDEVVGADQIDVLQALDDVGGTARGLNELVDRTDLDSSRVSYLIRGGDDARGLRDLDLVEVDAGTDTGIVIRLTPMGETIARGIRA